MKPVARRLFAHMLRAMGLDVAGEVGRLRAVMGLILLALLVFAVRLAGPPDLMHKAQHRTTAYTMDIVYNGQWIVQRDASGEVMSKPPLYNWITGAISLPFGQVNRLTMTLPAMVSMAALALLVFFAGERIFGGRAALLAGMGVLLTPLGMRHVAIARPDALFALLITAMALVAYASWQRGRGWFWFWLLAAAAILAKGPLCLLIVAAGMLFVIWERRPVDAPRVRWSGHIIGIAICLLICGGWFAGAYWQLGPALIDKMIGQELIGHALAKERSTFGSGFYKPLGYFLWDTLPWSIALVPAVWRVVRQPAGDEPQRRFERFLLCWLAGGLVIFSLAAHQRGNLLLPLLPPAALLAGREMAQRLASLSAPVFARGAAVASLLFAAAMSVYFIWIERTNERVIETVACMEMADGLSQRVGRGFPWTYADAPFAVQFYNGTMQREVSTEQALELLGDESPAFVVVRYSRREIEQALRAAGLAVFRVYHQPMSRGPDLYVLSNVAELEATERFAAATGAVHLRGDGLRLLKSRERSFLIEGEGELSIRNISDHAHPVRVKYHTALGLEQYVRKLASGETWDLILSAGNVMETVGLGE